MKCAKFVPVFAQQCDVNDVAIRRLISLWISMIIDPRRRAAPNACRVNARGPSSW
jgi:hypothetical protein